MVATYGDGDVTSNLVTVIEVSPDPADPDAVALDGTVIDGTSGDDVIFGSAGDDQITGDAGNDIFHFASDQGNDQFSGGDGGGWSDTIVLSDGLPTGDVNDWLSLDTGTVESTADGEVFLSEDAAGTITIGDVELTFEGVEKIEG